MSVTDKLTMIFYLLLGVSTSFQLVSSLYTAYCSYIYLQLLHCYLNKIWSLYSTILCLLTFASLHTFSSSHEVIFLLFLKFLIFDIYYFSSLLLFFLIVSIYIIFLFIMGMDPQQKCSYEYVKAGELPLISRTRQNIVMANYYISMLLTLLKTLIVNETTFEVRKAHGTYKRFM